MSCIRFGVFEFDPETGKLARDGRPVRLQPQPAKALELLLNARGALVSRDDLRASIWGDGTFVDFDRGLNFSISQLRSALGDSAESPRYIATVPRKGYRFIAPIQAEPVQAAPPQPPARRRMWAAAAAVAAALALAGLFSGWQPTPPGSAVIAVARFDNETGDAALDRLADGIPDTLVADLAGRGRFQVIGNAAMLRLPRDQRDLGQIAAALQARFVILGQIQNDAPRIRVIAHLISLPDQKHVTAARFQRAFDDVLTAEQWFSERILQELEPHLSSQTLATN